MENKEKCRSPVRLCLPSKSITHGRTECYRVVTYGGNHGFLVLMAVPMETMFFFIVDIAEDMAFPMQILHIMRFFLNAAYEYAQFRLREPRFMQIRLSGE